MAYTFTFTGVIDEITDLIVEEWDIKVTFKSHGFFNVNRIMNEMAYTALKDMKVGQNVLVATHAGRLMQVKPKN